MIYEWLKIEIRALKQNIKSKRPGKEPGLFYFDIPGDLKKEKSMQRSV